MAFTYNNLATTIILGAIEDAVRFVPVVGSLVGPRVQHPRLLLPPDCAGHGQERLCVPRLAVPLSRQAVDEGRNVGPGVVQLGAPASSSFMRFIRRGQLTFRDGTIVYHTVIFIRRAQYIAQEANLPAGQ